MSLEKRSLLGAMWLLVSNGLQKVLSVATFIVLARLMEPASFGLFAMTFVVINALAPLKYLGVDAALIQRKGDIELAANTAYILVVGLGVAFFLVSQIVAPWAAIFFRTPELAETVRALGVVFVLTSIGKIPLTILDRDMRYKEITRIEVIGALVNSVVAVLCAAAGLGVWSLVIAYLVRQLQSSWQAYQLTSFRPRWQFDPELARELFGFGKFLSGMGLVWYLATHVDQLVVGQFLGAEALGYFVLASNVTNFASTHLVSIVSRVLFPAYAQVQGDVAIVRRGFLRSLQLVSWVSLPFGMFLAVLGPEIVSVLYGVKWQPAVLPLQILSVASIYDPLFACSQPVFLGLGRPEASFRISVLTLLVRAPLIVVMTRYWGTAGAALAHLLSSVVVRPYQYRLVRELTGVRWRDYFDATRTAAIGTAIAGTYLLLGKAVLAGTPMVGWLGSGIVRLGALGVSAAMVYMLSCSRLNGRLHEDVKTLLAMKRD